MNLSTQANPARQLAWQGKSLAICSRKELIECILHLTRQLAVAQEKLSPASEVELPAERIEILKS